MSGPIVRAVLYAARCQELADRDNLSTDFGGAWYHFSRAQPIIMAHHTARVRDEAACGPKEKARRDAERTRFARSVRPTWQMAFA